MSISTFSFISSIIVAIMTLAFTILGITYENEVSLFIGFVMGYGTIMFVMLGIILNDN